MFSFTASSKNYRSYGGQCLDPPASTSAKKHMYIDYDASLYKETKNEAIAKLIIPTNSVGTIGYDIMLLY